MTKIVFASNNRDKWLELVEDFRNVGIDLILSEKHLNIEENEQTLYSNSFAKARSAARQTGMMAIGDDSGIFIESRDYWPGVHSRRWWGSPADDRGRCEKIIEEMKGEADRRVYLISRFVLVNEKGEKLYSTAVKNLFNIAEEIHGSKGFGYDPILIPADTRITDAIESGRINVSRAYDIEEQRLTIGELSQEEKNAINNRGRIAVEIKRFLDDYNKKVGI